MVFRVVVSASVISSAKPICQNKTCDQEKYSQFGKQYFFQVIYITFLIKIYLFYFFLNFHLLTGKFGKTSNMDGGRSIMKKRVIFYICMIFVSCAIDPPTKSSDSYTNHVSNTDDNVVHQRFGLFLTYLNNAVTEGLPGAVFF